MPNRSLCKARAPGFSLRSIRFRNLTRPRIIASLGSLRSQLVQKLESAASPCARWVFSLKRARTFLPSPIVARNSRMSKVRFFLTELVGVARRFLPKRKSELKTNYFFMTTLATAKANTKSCMRPVVAQDPSPTIVEFVLAFSYHCTLCMRAKRTLTAVSEPDARISLFSTARIR
jgi:hypothetical protein